MGFTSSVTKCFFIVRMTILEKALGAENKTEPSGTSQVAKQRRSGSSKVKGASLWFSGKKTSLWGKELWSNFLIESL